MKTLQDAQKGVYLKTFLILCLVLSLIFTLGCDDSMYKYAFDAKLKSSEVVSGGWCSIKEYALYFDNGTKIYCNAYELDENNLIPGHHYTVYQNGSRYKVIYKGGE